SAVVFDENILADPYGLESMVSAVFTVHRYRWAAQDAARSGEPNSADALLRCHRRHRVLLAARVDTDEDRPDPADLRGGPEERARYARSLARLLERPATRDGHRRALLLLLDELESLLPPGGRERREVMAVSQHLVHSYSEAADLHDTLIGIAELAALHAPALLDDLYLRPHPPELDLYRDL
ncbi:MAG: hypothetical protein KC729_21140, partial [Candidatus Eisenbacteria bacterium]|nr:hypothetical protein [Candidatus Eisenbacteria bacterium]